MLVMSFLLFKTNCLGMCFPRFSHQGVCRSHCSCRTGSTKAQTGRKTHERYPHLMGLLLQDAKLKTCMVVKTCTKAPKSHRGHIIYGRVRFSCISCAGISLKPDILTDQLSVIGCSCDSIYTPFYKYIAQSEVKNILMSFCFLLLWCIWRCFMLPRFIFMRYILRDCRSIGATKLEDWHISSPRKPSILQQQK